MRKAFSLLATLVLCLWFAVPAGAQTAGPTFEDSGPDQGDLEHEAPREIFIQFSENLGPSSSAQVYDECGRRLDDGAADIRGDTVWAQLLLRPSGRYLVVYSVSGEGPEAGTTEGSFTFRVHFGPSCGGEPGDGPGPGHGGHGDGPGDGPGPGHGGHGDGPGDGHGGHQDPGDGHGGHTGTGERHTGHPGGGEHEGHDPALTSHDGHPATMGGHSQHGSEKHEGAEHAGGHGKDHGSGSGPGDGEGDERDVALPDSGLNGLAPPLGTDIAVTAIALCIALGLFGGFALRASGR